MPAAGTNTRSNLTFTLSTDHDWGETPVGAWTLMVEDEGTGGTGSMDSFGIRIYGDDQGADTTYYYTDDFATLAGNRGSLVDTSGTNTINAAAMTTNVPNDRTARATTT